MGTINICESLINVVTKNKPNVLTGLDQNGTRRGMVSLCWAIVDGMPPAKRRDPHRSEIHVEQGKPVAPPATACEPQGTLLALWVEECEKSECGSVMVLILAETSPDAKAGRLSCGHSWRENLINC